MSVRWLSLCLVILAVTERFGCEQMLETDPDYISLGFFKNPDSEVPNNRTVQGTVKKLAKDNHTYWDGLETINWKNLRSGSELDLFEDDIQARRSSIGSLRSLIGKRRVDSIRMRREKLNLQGERSHKVHALESGRRRKLQTEDE